MLLCLEGLHNDPHGNSQAGGGQPGAQVAAGDWKRVLRCGDNQIPPEPPNN